MIRQQIRVKVWLPLFIICSLAAGVIIMANMASANVTIDEKSFPDGVFRTYVTNQFDTDKNNTLSLEEIQAATTVKVNKKNIEDLKGIELLTNVKDLECADNDLTALDLSKNTELVGLDCNGNNLTVLDVSNNNKLQTLTCYSNRIKDLRLGTNGSLENINISGNRLTKLQTNEQVKLRSLHCSNNQLSDLDLSLNTYLEELICNGNYLISLNVSSNLALKKLNSSSNNLTGLTLPSSSSLTTIYCSDNHLTSLSLSANTGLKTLDCSKNQLTHLELGTSDKLELLYCAENKITALDVSPFQNMISLDCRNNKLAFLDVELNTKLTLLKASGNKRDVYVDDKGVLELSGFSGFKLQNATEWTNAVLNGNDVETSLALDITFSYEMGNGKTETFTWMPAKTKQIILQNSEMSMSVSETTNLIPEFLGGASGIIWSSSNPAVAAVASDGKVTAKAAGETVISVSADGYTPAACTIKVYENVKNLSISDIAVQIYTGSEIKPTVTVTCDERTLTAGTDYQIAYARNVKVGNATIVITGMGSYSFEITREFTICYDISKILADEIGEQAYTGEAIMPSVVLKNGDTILKQEIDYIVQYTNNIVPGTGVLTITGKGDYTGEKLMTFPVKIPKVTNVKKSINQVNKITLVWDKIENVDGYRIYRYNTTLKKYERLVTIKGNSNVSYTDENRSSGIIHRYKIRAMVNINGKNTFGAYSTILKTTSKLPKVSLTVVSGPTGTKKAILSWKKITGATGYRAYMKEGASGKYAKIKTITKGATVKYTKTSLIKGNVYYFKVRAYKTINGQKIFGTYSTQIKATIK